jgi:hypothetical protein
MRDKKRMKMNTSGNDSASDPAEYYQLIRHRLEHEDNLIVQRLSWMVASQSFLFTAYAITMNGLAAAPAHTADRQQLLLRLVPVVGILSATLIYCGILAALFAMRVL